VVDHDQHRCHDLADPVPAGRFPDKIHAVIHCAAWVDESDTTHRVVHANVESTKNIARYAVTAGAKVFVNFSSIAVYGNPHRPDLVDESHACDTTTQYGLSKRMGELLCEATFEDRIRHVDLRLGYVLAPKMPEKAFFVQFAKKMKADQPIRLVNPDRTLFNFVGVADLCGIVRRVIESSVAGSFNVVADTHPTVREVFKTVRDHFPDYSGKIQVLEDADHVRDVRFANDKLKLSLGIEKLAGYGECLDSTLSTMKLTGL
jgi:nucleoside-diphosphate-sugar epimerase